MSPKADAYNVVTDKLIEAMEQGIVPWDKPWRDSAGNAPTSMSTGKPYRGINVVILSIESMLKGYTSPYWLTFKQAKQRGGTVRKGEKGTQIVLWKRFTKEVTEGGKTKDKSFAMLRHFTVFNVDQCDGIEAPAVEEIADYDPIEAAENLVTSWIERPEIKHGGNSAHYSPMLDYVGMPERGQFDSVESYYVTLFHELAHSTGHESRLNRPGFADGGFGTESYGKEELVAEFAAAFLAGEAGIDHKIERSASYLANWLTVLKNDRKMLVSAAAQAQKASDFVLGIKWEKEVKEEAAA